MSGVGSTAQLDGPGSGVAGTPDKLASMTNPPLDVYPVGGSRLDLNSRRIEGANNDRFPFHGHRCAEKSLMAPAPGLNTAS